jgi:hypothetical protein
LKKVYYNDKFAASLTRRYSNTPGPVLNYQFASEADTQRIIDFLFKNVIPSSPLFDSLGANPKELMALFMPIIESSVKEHGSLLGFFDEKLVAISIHSIHKVSGESNDQHVDIVPCKDYTQSKRSF